MLQEATVKVLDHGYVKLVETWGSDERVIEAARMSTQQGFKGWGAEEECDQCAGDGTEQRSHGRGPGSLCKPCRGSGRRVNTPGDEKLLKFLWDNRHTTPFEMAGAIFEVQAPIFVFREWHRHRMQSYNEASARYSPLPDVNYVPTIERLMGGPPGQPGHPQNKQAGTAAGAQTLTEDAAKRFLKELNSTYAICQDDYETALATGIPKELARLMLPVGRYSRMRAQAVLLNWMRFAGLRSDMNPGAQWEIRQYANAVLDILDGVFPRTVALVREKPL